jgi:hypothetical protein
MVMSLGLLPGNVNTARVLDAKDRRDPRLPNPILTSMIEVAKFLCNGISCHTLAGKPWYKTKKYRCVNEYI